MASNLIAVASTLVAMAFTLVASCYYSGNGLQLQPNSDGLRLPLAASLFPMGSFRRCRDVMIFRRIV